MTGLKRCHVIYIKWFMIYLISHSIHATSAPFQFVGLDRMGMLLVYPINKLTFYFRYRGLYDTYRTVLKKSNTFVDKFFAGQDS